MTKYSLDIELSTEFELLGISTYLPDYRLTWLINTMFGLHLKRQLDIVIDNHQAFDSNDLFGAVAENQTFATYSYSNEDNSEDVQLIANRFNGNVLLKRFPKTDYFLKIDSSDHCLFDYHSKLIRHEHVQSIEEIDMESMEKDLDIFYTNE
jgi:hypothetical protein